MPMGQFTEAEIIGILQEVAGAQVRPLCQRCGISEKTCCRCCVPRLARQLGLTS